MWLYCLSPQLLHPDSAEGEAYVAALNQPPLMDAVFYRQGKPITAGQLLAQSTQLAAQLSNAPAVINLADNRLDFALGF